MPTAGKAAAVSEETPLRPAAATLLFALCGGLLVAPARADDRAEACKKAMNDRIQVCTDDCTRRALSAASDYVDTNHNVKFGCMKGCAVRQVMQMKVCRDGGTPGDGDIETNR